MKNIDYKMKKLYHAPFMLNRILIEPQVFATQSKTLFGGVDLCDLDERVHSPDIINLSSKLQYQIKGGVDKWQRPFLDLSITGDLKLCCQRCMQPVDFALDELARIVLFSDEHQLDEAMLADEELEGILLEDELDIFNLLEDQILMALPISPKHNDCDNKQLDAINQDKPNPFAALTGLKKG